jgi:hypothetical protein
METKRRTAFLAVIALMAFSTVISAQPAAEKPKVIVGDAWQFARTMKPSDKADTWSRTVMEAPGEDQLRVKLGSGTVEDYDGAMNFMPSGNPDFRRPLVVYPLAVGKEWPIARKFENPSLSENGKAKVVAIEPITVPAGTFQCYRIEANSSQGGRQNSTQRSWVRWYCPDVKWIAKEIVETIVFNRSNPGANGTTVETSELVRFTPGK